MLGIPPFAITILLKRLDYSILFSIFTQVSQVVYVRAKSFFPSYRRAVRNNVYGNIPYGRLTSIPIGMEPRPYRDAKTTF